jgi:hypothetical protein
MSIEGIDQVLYRWLLDPKFRDALADDPEATLESYDLDREERARLSRMRGGRGPAGRQLQGTVLRVERVAR